MEDPQAVVARRLKRFYETYDSAIAQRIAGPEFEHYTCAGAALGHVSALLLHEPAEQRQLLNPMAGPTTLTLGNAAVASRTCARP
jgi:nitric oxide reductase activation protein